MRHDAPAPEWRNEALAQAWARSGPLALIGGAQTRARASYWSCGRTGEPRRYASLPSVVTPPLRFKTWIESPAVERLDRRQPFPIVRLGKPRHPLDVRGKPLIPTLPPPSHLNHAQIQRRHHLGG